MSCGLGAVILVLMLVKYQSDLPDPHTSALQADIDAIESEKQQSAQRLQTLQNQTGVVQSRLARLNAQHASLLTQIKNEQDAHRSLQEQTAELEARDAPPEQAPAAPIPVTNDSLEDYLLGLKVEGEKIVILSDSSASMTEERLIDIIRYKVAPEKERQKAAKWQRTLRIMEWLIAKVPAGSEYKVIHYAEQADFVGGNNWKKGADPRDAATVRAGFTKIVPTGGTNLHKAVTLMRQSAAGFTNVYLITDGLPTQGRTGKLGGVFSGCASLTGRAQTISGKCRRKLLDNIIASYRETAPVNVILLPLEGDSGAAGTFWRWAAKNAGLLIAPEATWP